MRVNESASGGLLSKSRGGGRLLVDEAVLFFRWEQFRIRKAAVQSANQTASQPLAGVTQTERRGHLLLHRTQMRRRFPAIVRLDSTY